MRHRVAHRKLGRVTEHRIALLRNQAQALLRHERIETTVPKAKELRPYVERLISIAKRSLAIQGDEARVKRMNAERLVSRDLSDQKIVTKLFEAIAPRYTERPGGYTRLLRIGRRRGDAAEVAQVELVGSEFDPSAAEGAPAEEPKTLRGRARAAVRKLQDEGTTDGDAKPSRARKATKKDE
jgi:large subunit ribosomal protein L17